MTNKKILYLAFLSALSISLFAFDALLPKPFPFLKLGLSNSIIVYLIYEKRYFDGIIVALSKVFIGNLIMGTIFSPGFLLSFSGTFFALFFMIIFKLSHLNFSILGISIIGAEFHNLFQILTARIVLIQDNSIFYFLPFLILIAVLTGIISGYIAIYLKTILINRSFLNYEYQKVSN